jgi:hypothetical protein
VPTIPPPSAASRPARVENFFALLPETALGQALGYGYEFCERLACRYLVNRRRGLSDLKHKFERVLADPSRCFKASYIYDSLFVFELGDQGGLEECPDPFDFLFECLREEEETAAIVAAYMKARIGEREEHDHDDAQAVVAQESTHEVSPL